MTLPSILWTLDRGPVDGDPLSILATLGGYHRSTVVVPASQARRAAQGSILTAWLADGTVLWEGRLAQPPSVDSGLARLEASGPKIGAEKAHGRVVYQSRGGWVDATGPPHNYAQANTPASAQVSNVVAISTDNPTGASQTFTAKIAAWFPGIAGITRYAFAFTSGVTPSIVTRLGNGPSGTLSTEATHTTSPVDRIASAATFDMLVLEISVTLGAQSNNLLVLSDVRINGVDTGDIYTTSDVVKDLGRRLGYDISGVRPSGLNLLPLDIQAGSWASAGFDLAATLDDWQWRALEDRGAGPILEYTPWERTWVVTRAESTPELTPKELFNRVVVWWEDDASVRHSVTLDASPDPLAASGITNVYELVLPGPQANDALALAAAANLLPHLASPRYTGALRAVRAVREDGMPADPRLILPGDLLRIADWEDDQDLTLRVQETEPHEDGIDIRLEDMTMAASFPARAGLATEQRTAGIQDLLG